MLKILQNQRVRRIALGVYIACLSGLIFVFFVISNMAVPYSLYLQGPQDFVPGASHGLRGNLMNALNGNTLGRVSEATLTLEDERHTSLAQTSIRPGPGGHIHAQWTLPATIEPGPYTLVSRVVTSPGEPMFEARARVTLKAAPPAEPSWLPRTERMPLQERERTRLGRIEGSGPLAAHLSPAEPVLVRGLPGEVYVLTAQASGEPMPCRVYLPQTKGLLEGGSLPESVRTNTFGIARLRLSPTTTHHWHLESDCAPQGFKTPEPDVLVLKEGEQPPRLNRSRHQLGTAPAQLSLQTRQPWVAGGAELMAGAQSLLREGPVFVDLYDEERWIWSGAFGLSNHTGAISVPLPAVGDDARVYRIQATSDVYAQGRAWDVEHVLALPAASSEASMDRAILALAARHAATSSKEEGVWAAYFGWLAAHPGALAVAEPAQKHALLRMLLHHIPAHRTAPAVLINSLDDDQRALETWQKQVRTQLLVLIAFALLIGFALLMLVVIWGIQQARYKQQLLHDVDMELAEQDLSGLDGALFDADAKSLRDGQLARAMAFFQGAVVLGTLVLFAASIMVMLKFMM